MGEGLWDLLYLGKLQCCVWEADDGGRKMGKKAKGMRFAFRICPQCGSKELGKIAKYTYFCWGCFAEIVVKGQGNWPSFETYNILEDGTLEMTAES